MRHAVLYNQVENGRKSLTFLENHFEVQDAAPGELDKPVGERTRIALMSVCVTVSWSSYLLDLLASRTQKLDLRR
jgi:hypothetical protein